MSLPAINVQFNVCARQAGFYPASTSREFFRFAVDFAIDNAKCDPRKAADRAMSLIQVYKRAEGTGVLPADPSTAAIIANAHA